MKDAPEIFIEESKTGSPTMNVRRTNGTVLRLHSLHDPESEAAKIVGAFPFDGAGILVILGLGLGYHLAEFRRRYPGADIVVVEGKREIHDLFERFGKVAESADRIRYIVGASPREAIEEIASHQLKAGLPPLTGFVFAPELAAFPEYYLPIKEALDKTSSFRLWDRLRYPKLTGDRHTIALFDFGYFVTEEIARAVVALGHEIVRVPGNKNEKSGDLLEPRHRNHRHAQSRRLRDRKPYRLRRGRGSCGFLRGNRDASRNLVCG